MPERTRKKHAQAAPKREDFSLPLDEKTLAEWRVAAASNLQRCVSSESFFNLARSSHQVPEQCLVYWESRLLPSARRYKNPVRFCEKMLGIRAEDYALPDGTTARQVQALIWMTSELTTLMTGPMDLVSWDGKFFLKCLQILTAKPPGRKQSDEYSKALELKRAGKSTHRICLALNPAYEQMSSAARRNERNRIESGIKRREEKEKSNPQGPRNTSR